MGFFQMLFYFYALAHLYIFICLRRAFGGGKWQIPVIIWLIFMAAFWLFRFTRPMGTVGEKIQDVNFIWMGLLIFLCYCFLAADIAALLPRILAAVTGAEPLRRLSAFLVAPRYIPVAMAAALLLFAYGLYEAQTPRITRIALSSHKLPSSHPPLRIVAVSDMHIGGLIGPRTLRRMADKIAGQEPDILLLTGDIVDTNMFSRDKEADILRNIPARLGKFVVTGNHEYYRGYQMSLDFFRKSGLRALRGEAVEAGGITLAGVDDYSMRGKFSPDTTDVMRVLRLAPRDRFTLLLNHQPYYPDAAIGLFDLQFSGHTHSGQFWPGSLLIRKFHDVAQGMNQLHGKNGSSLLYVSNGIGFWGPPIRFFAPPEITVFTITPAKEKPSR